MKSFKKVRCFLNKYVNGTKGVVSIFLAIVMMPFISIAVLLEESARYQSSIELVDELLDCVGVSSLSNYDEYLEKRFGLLALSQGSDISKNYDTYLKKNLQTLSGNFSLNDTSVKEVYPLSDKGVLKNQLLEYSEVTVATEAVYNGLDVDTWMKKIYENMNVDDLTKMADATKGISDVASSTADLVNAIKDVTKEYGNYKTQLSEYKTAANNFHTKANTLINTLKTTASGLGEDEESITIYKKDNVKNAVKELKNACSTFSTEAGEMATSVDKMKTSVEKLFTTVNSITTNINSAKESMDKYTGTTLQEDCTKTTSEWIIEISNEVTNTLNKMVDTDYSNKMKKQSDLLKEEKTNLGKVVCDSTAESGSDSDLYYINRFSKIDKIKTDFPLISVDSIKSGFDNVLDKKIEELDNNKSSVSEEERNLLGNLLDIAGGLLKVTAFYDGALDANVAPSAFYQYNSMDMSFTSFAIMTSLTTIVESGEEFVNGLSSGNIFKVLKAAATFLLGISEFLVSIVSWVVETLFNLVKLIASGSEIYDSFLLSAYGVYNMPCRTTYSSGKPLTGGVSYKSIFTMQNGTSGNYITGTMDDLKTLMSSKSAGVDTGFRGAETEYLLIGGENELLNQSAAFFNLYMLRMVLDLVPIFKNNQVQTMASSANVAGWVVYLTLIIAEPMIDALMLVNNQSSYLVKDQVYLTPGGIVLLIETLPSLTGLSNSVKSDIKNTLIAKNGKTSLTGSFSMNYQEHMLLLLLLSVDQSKYLSRMQNLIQMELAQNYKGSYEFKLDNANTYLEVSVNGKLNSMFDVKSLTEGGIPISRKRYMGY